MVFKNYRLGIIVRAIILSLAIFLTIFSAYKKQWYVTTFFALSVSIFLLVELIRYAEKFKRGLVQFLLSIKSRDFISTSSLVPGNNSGNMLRDAYKTIIDEFQNIRIDKEIQYHYLKSVVDHVKIAFFSFNENGRIEFINKRAQEILNTGPITNIHSLEKANTGLFLTIKSLLPGTSRLVKIKINETLMHLSVYVTELIVRDKKIKLVSMQDIKEELEYHELESWQKLIRVLTHEIMNSVTPISSLSNAINETFREINFNKTGLQDIHDDDFQDIMASLQSIEGRSKGLLKFVTSYKQLTRIPKPDFAEVSLGEIINHCLVLLKTNFSEKNIRTEYTAPQENIITYADYDQIEQVIINLLLNASDAVQESRQPKITVKLYKDESNKCRVSIKDNGKGIHPEDMDKIFIPFYTTKKNGSGIGLSLSRQIMHQHRGAIIVYSKPNGGSEFIISL